MKTAPANTRRLLAREVAGTLTAPQLIDWAVEALCAGYDTPGLRQLAGLDMGPPPDLYDALEAFRRTLRELQFAVPEPEQLLRDHLRELAQDVVAGTLEPEVAVEQIHREVLGPLKHPSDLMAWCYLWEGLDPHDFASLQGDALRRAIRATARELASGDRPA